MIDRRALWTFPLVGALVFGATTLLARWPQRQLSRRAPAGAPVRAPMPPRARPPRSEHLRFIVAGGGPSPELNQVQIEQDLGLANTTFRELGPTLLLFAGGPDSHAVQVLGEVPADPVREVLGTLFNPRGGRDSVYRESRLVPHGAATREALLSALDGALVDGDDPITVYLAGHGQGGETPTESRFLTWGADDLWVEDLAELLDETPGHRPLRFVITACYAGGFAELAFRNADPEEGPAATERCGFFATTWDRTAAGCDPNPDRGAQEGYGIHFLHALRGRDRAGRRLAAARIDLDRDGVISLLEAHTFARIESRSIDVPVTTSERFLRAALDPDGPVPNELAPIELPEERAVIDALLRALRVRDAQAASERLATITARMEETARELDTLEDELSRAEEQLAAALLHRWPQLEDPWRTDFESTLARERGAIRDFLEESAEAAELASLRSEHERRADEHDALLVESAPLERLTRAFETLDLAARLADRGGHYWRHYETLRACESAAP